MAGLSRSWFGKSRAVVETTTAIKLQRELCPHPLWRVTLKQSRFFTRGLKLDYPNPETSKASKKYVRAMKSLPVSSSTCVRGMIAK